MGILLATSEDTLWCAPGGSSVTGALGHLNAALELAEQVRAGEIPQPDVIVVGAGTCGTMAGLTAGFRLAGLDVRLIGVRCVDRIVCHLRAIARLANGVLARIGVPGRVHAHDITLVESPLDHGYGVPLGRAEELMASFEADEGIRLDTTYTSKVVAKLGELLTSGMFTGKNVLYWHTFSPAAMHWGQGRRQQGLDFVTAGCRGEAARLALACWTIARRNGWRSNALRSEHSSGRAMLLGQKRRKPVCCDATPFLTPPPCFGILPYVMRKRWAAKQANCL